MSATKPILNMAAYAIIIVLILMLGLAVLKARSAANDNTEIIDAAAQMAQDNKTALDGIDNTIDGRIDLTAKVLGAKITSLQTQTLRMQQQLAELEKKLNDSQSASSDLKWVVNPVTRHRYSVIPYPLPWHYAREYAEKNGGHLVVIGDEVENEWVVSTFGGDTEYWMGLTDEAEEGKWVAVNGETQEYFNWAKPEPDNYRKYQHYAIINSKAPHLGQTEPGKWNDVPCNEVRIGIIEQTVQTMPAYTRTRILP